MARKLLDRLRDKIRVMHYSPKTEGSYVSWIRRFILFHNKRILKKWESLKLRHFSPFWLLTKKSAQPHKTKPFMRLSFCMRKCLISISRMKTFKALRAK